MKAVIKRGDVFIYDDGKQGYLMELSVGGCFRPLNDSEKNFEDILELDEYNRQNH